MPLLAAATAFWMTVAVGLVSASVMERKVEPAEEEKKAEQQQEPAAPPEDMAGGAKMVHLEGEAGSEGQEEGQEEGQVQVPSAQVRKFVENFLAINLDKKEEDGSGGRGKANKDFHDEPRHPHSISDAWKLGCLHVQLQ